MLLKRFQQPERSRSRISTVVETLPKFDHGIHSPFSLPVAEDPENRADNLVAVVAECS
jgi:hypothetical protein